MRVASLCCLAGSVCAFSPPVAKCVRETNQLYAVTRKDFLQAATVFSAAGCIVPKANAEEESFTLPDGVSPKANAEVESFTLPNGVSYDVIKKGDGPKPGRGELAAIRFAAFAGKNKIDDIFVTPEPYYTRIGSGAMLKGVEETLPLMRVGDRWKLTIPGNLAFGQKGRPASAGKPRIPGDATIIFEVEIVGLPGKEQELIELIGD